MNFLMMSNTTVNSPLNPFNVDDDVISLEIKNRGIHDNPKTVSRPDVNPLFDFASKIVGSSSTNFPHSLDDLQQVTVNLVEGSKVSKWPTYSFLRNIACQLTKDSLKESNAHESVMEFLKQRKNYIWDAKAVIALSAFALDFGHQTWWLSLMQGSNNKKENALELHVFRLAEEKKKPDQFDNSSLINKTLELIKGIIKLEKLFDDKSYNPSNVPTLFEAPLDVYTYWAVFSIFACANNQVEPGMKIKLVERITSTHTGITDLIWRIKVFRNPQGIWELLKALIYPKDVDHFKSIANNTDKKGVSMEELKTTEKLFLFISPLDNIEREIEFLKLIFKSIPKDKRNKGYKILWVPVVKNWSEEAGKKFESLKCSMKWYVLHYPEPIHGYRVLQEEWNYQGKPIVVVADADGKVCNKNALPAIFLWGLEAFPYDPITIGRVSRHWNWIWLQVSAIHPPIQTWVMNRNKYVFLYGGTDDAWTQEFHGLVDGIKKELAEERKAYTIEHFKVEATDTKTENSFWDSISDLLLNYPPDVDSTTLSEMQSLLEMRSQKGWAIVSKGKEVLIIGYNEVMLNVLNGFKERRGNISASDFDVAIYNYYIQLLKQEGNIHSPMLIPYYCCPLPKEISSLACKCYHGFYYSDD